MSKIVYGYGFKGLAGNVYSLGIEKAADNASQLGHHFVVGSHTQGRKFVQDIKKNKPRGPILVYGHSMGATRAVDFCGWLDDIGITVDCLITLDPHSPREQQANVKRHINIWQKGHIFGVKRFYPIAAVKGLMGTLENIVAKDVRHANLDDLDWVQNRIADEIATLADFQSVAVIPPSKRAGNVAGKSVETLERTSFNRAFFDSVRKSLFNGKLTQGQVRGINKTLDLWFKKTHLSDPRFLSYMLATVFLETDRTMLPISEYGNRGYFMRMYDRSGTRPRVARNLGNTNKGDGAKYKGRGKPMITGRANYRKATKYVGRELGVDFEAKPSAVLQSNHSDLIMFSGMIKGWFTGKKLADYFNEVEDKPVGARRIVNGQDKAKEIAGYHHKFLAAIISGAAAHDASITYEDPQPEITAPTKRSAPPIVEKNNLNIADMSTDEILQAIANALELEREAIDELASRHWGKPFVKAAPFQTGAQELLDQILPDYSSTGEPKMTRRKGLFNSKTFWGVIGVFASMWAPSLAPIIPGPEIAPEAAEQVSTHMRELVEMATKITGTLSALYSMYGRFAAREQISGLFSAKE